MRLTNDPRMERFLTSQFTISISSYGYIEEKAETEKVDGSITMEAILGEKNRSSVDLEEFDGNHRLD